MPLSSGQVLNNRYHIRAVLSQGRQEAVYSALDSSLNSPVVVKEILNTSPDCVQGFAYEARRLANLRHPGLPYVVDHFSAPGMGQYLIMQFVEGQDLQSLINQAGRGLAWAQTVSWFGQVGDALAFLHMQTPPIIHRQVTPANIRITQRGQAILVGYGIIHSPDPGYRATVVAGSGSTAFLSPEFFTGDADIRSDIYSLGATLYATLTGRAPIDSLKRQAGQSLTPPRQINPAIPPGIEPVIVKAMEIAPGQRYPSIREMMAALGIKTAVAAAFPGANQIAPTIQVERLEPVKLPARDKRSVGWITGVIIGILALCLLTGILGGIGVYTYIFAPSQTAVRQTDANVGIEETATALHLSLVSSPDLTATDTQQIPPSATPSQTPTPTLSPSPTLPPSASLPPTATQIPSPTVAQPLNPTWMPCPGTYASRLQVGNQAYVSYDPPLANRVRSQPNAASAIIGFIQPGEKVAIIGGPICSNEWIWWQTRSLQTGMTGWTAEGDRQSYWLVPLP